MYVCVCIYYSSVKFPSQVFLTFNKDIALNKIVPFLCCRKYGNKDIVKVTETVPRLDSRSIYIQ